MRRAVRVVSFMVAAGVVVVLVVVVGGWKRRTLRVVSAM